MGLDFPKPDRKILLYRIGEALLGGNFGGFPSSFLGLGNIFLNYWDTYKGLLGNLGIRKELS